MPQPRAGAKQRWGRETSIRPDPAAPEACAADGTGDGGICDGSVTEDGAAALEPYREVGIPFSWRRIGRIHVAVGAVPHSSLRFARSLSVG